MSDLPNMKPQVYSKNEESEFEQKGRALACAARYGVERKFLKFATPEYLECKNERYDLHNFAPLLVGDEVISPEEQLINALYLLDSGHLWCDPPTIIIINSPRYVFDDDDADKGVDCFLSHILCSLANRAINPIHTDGRLIKRSPTVNFLGSAIDIKENYKVNERHLFVWGTVVVDHYGDFDYLKTIRFLSAFKSHTKILLTCAKDMGKMLELLKINPKKVAFFFNLDDEKDSLRPPYHSKARRPATPKRTMAI